MERTTIDEADLKDIALEAFNGMFPYAVVLLEPDLTVTWVSAGFGRLLGYPEAEVIGSPVMDLVHPDDVEEVLPLALEFLSDAKATLGRPTAASTVEIPARIRSHSGEWRPMSIAGRLLDEDGRTVCVMRPAAERRALDVVLAEIVKGSEGQWPDAIVELLRAQFDLSEAWMIHEVAGEVSVYGSTWQASMGDICEMLNLVRGLDVVVSDDERFWLIPVPSATSTELQGMLVMPAVRSGGPSPYDLHVIGRTTTLAEVAFGRAEMDRMLHLSATTDYLTGLLNRRAFDNQVAALGAEQGRYPAGALFVDLDDFKAVNDSWGHEVGDIVLVTVARRIRNLTRAEDIVARVGGDEFVVLCQGLDPDELELTRSRLETAVSQPMAIQSEMVSVSVSVGVSMADSADDLATLIGRSDQDMYERKNSAGRRPVDCSIAD